MPRKLFDVRTEVNLLVLGLSQRRHIIEEKEIEGKRVVELSSLFGSKDSLEKQEEAWRRRRKRKSTYVNLSEERE